MDDPRTAYSRLLEQRRAEIAVREQGHRNFGYLQLAAAACGLAVVWLALVSQVVSIAWMVVPVAVFTVFLVLHDRLLRALELCRRAARYFERALARLDGEWA